jgi:hypothetical protein
VSREVDNLGIAAVVFERSGSSPGFCSILASGVFDGKTCATSGCDFTALVPVGSD